jgi:hypothetical protein
MAKVFLWGELGARRACVPEYGRFLELLMEYERRRARVSISLPLRQIPAFFRGCSSEHAPFFLHYHCSPLLLREWSPGA